MTDPVLLEVGRVAKAHGLKGEVIVSLSTDRVERMQSGFVFATARGPLEIVTAKRHQERWRVQFRGVADRNAADALHGLVLLADPIEDPEAFFVHELIGAAVVDRDGKHLGTVESVEANAASDLLVLDSGPLIPLVFVKERRQGIGELVVELPDGLLELYLDV
jgi:16S rRNA processing protein RimM